MNTTEKKSNRVYLLIISAFIWGVAFVAQKEGGDAVGPFSFCFARSVIGALILLPVIAFLDKKGLSEYRPATKSDYMRLCITGMLSGFFIILTSIFQQIGLFYGTGAGKAGFLTACYIIIVPLLGMFFHKKCGKNIWIAVFIVLVGLYLLCIKGDFTIEGSDIVVFLAAVSCSLQILSIDILGDCCDSVRLSCIQFATGAIFAGILTVIFEMKPFSGGFSAWVLSFCSLDAWIPILFAGLFSNGIAYTLQVVAQKGANPTVASLLMSLESVFSVLAGAILLGEKLSIRELIGCCMIFFAVVLAQLPEKNRT